jgi:hypothetical protein
MKNPATRKQVDNFHDLFYDKSMSEANVEKRRKIFNTAGLCFPEDHYMVDPLKRLDEVMKLIDQEFYFRYTPRVRQGRPHIFMHWQGSLMRRIDIPVLWYRLSGRVMGVSP